MQTRTIEVGVGLFVAVGIAALFMLAMKVSNLSTFTEAEGYEIIARFDNIGSLKIRSPVTMAGVRVGRVAGIGFDDKSYEAVVRLNIDPKYSRIPVDTSASIYTAGLLGEQYVSLEAGGEERYLNAGGIIKLTQSAVVLEQVIGQFLYQKASEGGGAGGAPAASPGTGAKRK
jgi:phospholipid/cholesterol/gamma-HCH transport system substrate-binding protein